MLSCEVASHLTWSRCPAHHLRLISWSARWCGGEGREAAHIDAQAGHGGRYAVVTKFMDDLSTLATEPFCYLTTIGRGSGRPHTIEIWFALHGATVYLLSGGGEGSDWVKNL